MFLLVRDSILDSNLKLLRCPTTDPSVPHTADFSWRRGILVLQYSHLASFRRLAERLDASAEVHPDLI